MAQFQVDVNTATALRRPVGMQVTIVNNSAVVAYFDRNENYINSTSPGAVPNGIPVPAAAGGVPGSIQIDNFPGVVWFRAVTPTVLQVYP